MLNVSGSIFSQSTTFDLEVKGKTVKEVFKDIEGQSPYRFLYNDDFAGLSRVVSFNTKDKNIDEVLNKLLDDAQLTFRELDNELIVITPLDELAVQQREVKGTVTDANGESLPGVSVLVKGTTYGTLTNVDGTYTLDNVTNNTTLQFSFVGMSTQEILVGERVTINITMIEEAIGLEEVVAIGYGTQRRETLTGSVVNISGERLTDIPTPNVTATLAGKLPGLTVIQRSGEPGRDDPSILIRGSGTLNDNSPLIIIDGVERSQLGRLNPEDIESISVLKDASAAIYGARAANGVIIVTTKTGTIGKPVFSFSHNTAFQRPTIVPDVLDAVEFAKAFNEGDWYRQGRPDTFTPFYTEGVIQQFRDGSDPILYPNTNWVDEVMKPYSLQNRTSLQVNGGTEAIRYLLSFASVNQDGDFKIPTDYQQYNLRVKVDANINEYLNIGANINAIPADRQYTHVSNRDVFYNILRANPTLVSVYPNGLIGGGRLGQNPLLLEDRGYDRTRENPLFSTFTATLKIPFVDGLSVDASYNYDLNNQFQKVWDLPYFFNEYNVVSGEYDRRQADGATTVQLTDVYRRWTTSLFNYRVTYTNTFDDHHITAMVGQEQQQNTYNWAQAYRKNFVSPAIDQINVGSSAPEDKDNGGSALETAYNNYFGRFNYHFRSRYLLEFLFRYDGSQIFPEGKRYGFFPGFSIGWIMSEEDFIKNSVPFVDQLKLRLSHGEIGNDRVGRYQYLQSYSFGNNFVFGGNDHPGIYPNVMPNPEITWEVSKKTDIGLDASLWNYLLGLELTLWKENRSNILTARNLSIPNILGFSSLPNENIGEVDNHGVEVVLRHRNRFNRVNYNIEANTSFARSKIVFMDETPQAEPYQNRTGLPIGANLYYQADGIFNSLQELNSYPHVPGTQVGDVKILDLNDDGVIDSRDQFRFDKTNIPEIVFGLNMGIQYQNFDLNLFFQGQTNVYNYDGDFVNMGNAAFDNASVARAEDRWTVDNPDGTMPRSDTYLPGATTFFLFDATFVRLKNMEVGYSLPQRVTSRIAMDEVRLYLTGYNVLTWAKEIKWADPEASGGYLYYPQQRVISLGVNVKF